MLSSDIQLLKIPDEWVLLSDNDFATKALSAIQSKSLKLPEASTSQALCRDCKDVSQYIWEPFFQRTYDMKKLKSNSKSCDLCLIIWKRYFKPGMAMPTTVTITRRSDSSIRINDEGPPILSVYRKLERNKIPVALDESNQVGYPCLAGAKSENHFEVIRQWLEVCDSSHPNCCATSIPVAASASGSVESTQPRLLPKRVIDVGKHGDDKVYLRETRAADKGEWIALSHQWGQGKKFLTLPENLDSHLSGIAFAELPDTFRDAVQVTRALERRYLWIDSLCIVQGPNGDFNQEAKRMEDVYSGAYCVLAAARSPGHYEGFLTPRDGEERVTLSLQPEGHPEPFYICEAIDDFDLHVQQSTLNKRGWVFQEHALARRTVYFTKYQTYFECGDGIRCETMTKMENDLATFMGDPNFPRIIMGASQGERILRYQDLYKKYSSLDLSEDSDRPMAIDSLQSRVLKTLGAKGGYGIIDEGHKGLRHRGILRRSLLWRRSHKTPNMTAITFLPHHGISHVPSWSWMKYTGSIDYISPPFGDMDWEDLQSPWSSDVATWDALLADARKYQVGDALDSGDGEIIFDLSSKDLPSETTTRCIVLGRNRGSKNLKDSHKVNYLLVVEMTGESTQDGRQICKRVGAGYLPGKCIASEGVEVSVI